MRPAVSALRMRLRRAPFIPIENVTIGIEEFNMYEGDTIVHTVGLFGSVKPSKQTRIIKGSRTPDYELYFYVRSGCPTVSHCTCPDYNNPELDPSNGCHTLAAPYLGNIRFCKHLIAVWQTAEGRFPDLELADLERAILQGPSPVPTRVMEWEDQESWR